MPPSAVPALRAESVLWSIRIVGAESPNIAPVPTFEVLVMNELSWMVIDPVAEIPICPPCGALVCPFILAPSPRRNCPVVMEMLAGD
jgi:hypothetical protein